MSRDQRRVFVFVLLIFAALAAGYFLRGSFTFETLRSNRVLVQTYVDRHLAFAAAVFLLLFICTGLFLPGALLLTVSGGFFFGAVNGALLANLGSVTGATIAFLASRYFAGEWLQRRYYAQLVWFNAAFERYGARMLAAARVIPLFPFFLVNYFAGLTRMKLLTYISVTAAAMLPGSLVLSFAGTRLASIERPEDLVSGNFVVALLLAGGLVLFPVIVDAARRIFRKQ